MKKILTLSLFVCIFLLSGCGKKTVDMNVLGDNNQYNYKNQGMGFSVSLPKEFEYYQTQSIINDEFKSLEFYVPTSDTNYKQQVPGYGKSLEVRTYTSQAWESANKASSDEPIKKGDKIYLLKFWDTIPSDWRAKWNDNLAKGIKDSFKIE